MSKFIKKKFAKSSSLEVKNVQISKVDILSYSLSNNDALILLCLLIMDILNLVTGASFYTTADRLYFSGFGERKIKLYSCDSVILNCICSMSSVCFVHFRKS